MKTAARSLLVLLVVAGFGGLTQAQARVKRVSSSFHIGSAHPLGILDSLSDANIHVDVDLSYRLQKRLPTGAALYAKLLVGLNQFTAEIATGIEHPRWINASVNLQVVAPGAGPRPYVQAGPGVYWPKSGPAKSGLNIGVGEQVSVGVIRLEFGLDLHQVQSKPVTRFVTIQLGVLY
ncbi:MAG TPA: hypothetical protein VJ816_01265 [Gemmatimonadales bacterium]|nr:hypothetical protein [Gemmatimonadales bacterium]